MGERLQAFMGRIADYYLVVIFIIWLLMVSGAAGVKKSQVTELNEKNWNDVMEGEWMVEFYAPHCPACRGLEPNWEKFAKIVSEDINVARLDITRVPSLAGRFFVFSVPTILHVKDGEFREYNGARFYGDMAQYVKFRLWTTTKPIPGWIQPNTLMMSILSQFHQISHWFNNLHRFLQDQYHFKSWNAYGVLITTGIVVGTILCLLLLKLLEEYPIRYLATLKSEAIAKKLRDEHKQLLLERSHQILTRKLGSKTKFTYLPCFDEDSDVDSETLNEIDQFIF